MSEGRYNSRLEIIGDLPRGKVIWLFDLIDMARAKEILGNTACIAATCQSNLLTVGTAQEVEDYAKKLIDTAGKGGGYIMASGAGN